MLETTLAAAVIMQNKQLEWTTKKAHAEWLFVSFFEFWIREHLWLAISSKSFVLLLDVATRSIRSVASKE